MSCCTKRLATVSRPSTGLRSGFVRLRASRFYSTPIPRPPRNSNPLLVSAACGFAAGLGYVLVNRYMGNTTRLDSVPAVDAIETHGKPWTPIHALEADDASNPMRIRMATWVTNLQDHIVNTLETFEPHKKFKRDHWIRPEGGEGSSCVLAGGETFEKAGVNVSVVHGLLPPAAQAQMRAEHASIPISSTPLPFFATGVSIVLHPQSPHIPTVHLNYRYFELHNPGDDPSTTPPIAWWFGGGSDLTPNYLVEADATHFHQTLKDACDRHHGSYWQTYKKWCDKYFYIPHRKESRGVGGLFFDDLTTASEIHADRPKSQEEIFSFVKDISGAFLPAYIPIVEKNRRQPWTEAERSWQLLRRGRYVEFNLVYDRGTKFGLMTPGARIESILMSLPDTARWEYMSEIGTAGSGTEEEKLVEVLKNPKEWV